MSIKDNFSLIKPTLFLDFMKSKKLDPRITFGRSDSTQCATYTDAGGIIRTVPANTPRFNHRYDTASSSYVSAGLSLEEDRTNILRDSAFSSIAPSATNNAWFDAFPDITATSNSIVSPDGTNSAALLSITAATTSRRIEQRTGSITAGTYAYSVYCKAAGSDNLVRLLLSSETSFTNYIRANFTLSGNGTATAMTPIGNAVAPAVPIITPVGNGWYRCTIFATLTAPTNITVLIYPGNAGAQTTNSQTYVWGSQLEQTASNAASPTTPDA